MLLNGHKNDISSLAFSPDGQWLVSGDYPTGGLEDSSAIFLWSLGDPSAEPISLPNQQGFINSVAISPDGQWLAVHSEDRAVRFWQMVDLAKVPLILTEGEDYITSIAFSPDSRWLAGSLIDNTVKLWPTLNGLVEIGCQVLRRNLTLAEWNRYLPDETYRSTCPNLPAHTTSQ